MDQGKIEKLIAAFNAHRLNVEEQKEFERLIESGMIDLSSLREMSFLEDQVQNLPVATPSPSLDDRFYKMLATEKNKARSRSSWKEFFKWPNLVPKIALASVVLIAGIAIGLLVNPSSENTDEMRALREEVTDLKEMMMLSLLEKESATERLRAVSLTEQMDYASSKVTSALLETLNNDENVNVRLAALDALKPYVRDSNVRAQLIRSIAQQNSPLVQVALAELMAKIQERSSVKELEKIIRSERTPEDVKKRIQESIKVLS